MKCLEKMLCLGVALLAASGGFAETPDETTQNQSQTQQTQSQKQSMKQKTPPFEQGMGLPANKYPAAYNAPGCISVKNGWDIDFYGSFIMWHVSEDFLDSAFVHPVATASPLTTFSGAVAYQDFKYEPGFKVGVGFNTNYDGWVFWGEYTWFHQNIRTNAVSAPTFPSGAPGFWEGNDWFTTTGNLGSQVESSWKVGLDMIDVVFSHPYYEGAQLVAMPFGGLKAYWLRQNFNIELENSSEVTVATSNNKSRSWAIGPTTGVYGHWLLGAGFRFEGKASGSIVYQRFTTLSHSEQDSQALTPGVLAVTSSESSSLNTLRPSAQLAVGLGWGTYYGGGEYYFDLSADYEFNYFWEQNLMRAWVGQIQGYADAIGDLQLHGVTITARFDF